MQSCAIIGFFSRSGKSPSLSFHQITNSRKSFSIFCSEIPFFKSSYHMETSQLMCISIDWLRFFTESYFPKDYGTSFNGCYLVETRILERTQLSSLKFLVKLINQREDEIFISELSQTAINSGSENLGKVIEK